MTATGWPPTWGSSVSFAAMIRSLLGGAVLASVLILTACGDEDPSASEGRDQDSVDGGVSADTTTSETDRLCEGAQLLREWWDIDAPSPEQFPNIEQGLGLVAEAKPDLAEDVAIVGAPFGLGDASQDLDLMASGEAQQRIDEVVVAECGEPIWG